MDAVGFLVCFIVSIMNLFSKGTPDSMIFAASLIGMGLCAIANSLYGRNNDSKKN